MLSSAHDPADLPLVVAGLWIYPVKSCAGMPVARAQATARGGFEGDREWVVVNADGALVWQGELPRMALVRASLSEGVLILRARDMPPLELPGDDSGAHCEVKIWNDKQAAFDTFGGTDAGPRAQRWLGDVLGQPLRLVRLGEEALRRESAQPLHVLSVPSLDELDRRLRQRGHAPAEVERFRPNILIASADPLLTPFLEDSLAAMSWPCLQVRIGEACVRCVMPNVDPRDASVGEEPLATVAAISAERRPGSPACLGAYGRAVRPGTLSVGEAGAAALRF